jgi:GNAT superfamily N-acetyltransferase
MSLMIDRETDVARLRLAVSDLGAFNATLARLPGARACGGPDVRWVATGTPVLNRVWGARLEPAVAQRRVTDVLDEFRRRGARTEWMVAPFDRPERLGRTLREAGCGRVESWSAMSLPLSERPATADVGRIAVREAASREDAVRWAATFAAAAVRPRAEARALELVFARLLDEGAPLRLFEALHGGRPVAACALHGLGAVVGLHQVATLPAVRRRGVARALVTAALARAQACGARIAVTQADAAVRPLVEALGFAGHGTIEVYTWQP